MIPCASCSSPIRPGTCACPNCGASACAKSYPTSAAILLGLALTGCGLIPEDPAAVAVYGVPVVEPPRPVPSDADKDGFDVLKDCDDTNAAVHPEAVETAGDKIDSDCDGNDDT